MTGDDYSRVRSLFSALLLIASTSAASAEEAGELSRMISQGEVHLDFRYRFEHVDQSNFSRDANASTLRSRLSFVSAPLKNFQFGLEFDDLTSIGSQRYNSFANGKTDYPVVADPEGTDINQVYLKYAKEDIDATYGRQRIVHSDQRFVGGVAWRQNEQTYDGFRAGWKPNATMSLDYSYVYNVNRIFGPDDSVAQPANLGGDNHFFYAKYKPNPEHQLALFAYLLDIESQNDPNGSPYASGKTVNNSTDTWGAEYNGDFTFLKLRASAAIQSDAGDSDLDYEAYYYTVQLSKNFNKFAITAGIEVLEAGDNEAGSGFRTPLATLHKFQGWADKFLTTPNGGIEDKYAGISGAIGPVKLVARYHDFRSEDSSFGFRSYGSEFDVAATWPITKEISTQLKYADFDSSDDSFTDDAKKIWFTLQLKI